MAAIILHDTIVSGTHNFVTFKEDSASHRSHQKTVSCLLSLQIVALVESLSAVLHVESPLLVSHKSGNVSPHSVLVLHIIIAIFLTILTTF